MNQLLQNESYMEKLDFGLQKLLDGFKGASSHEDIPKMHKELYVFLEEKCTNLYGEMRQIKETFQRHKNRRGNSFLGLSSAWMNSRNCIYCSLKLSPLARLLVGLKRYCSSRGFSSFIPHCPLSFLFFSVSYNDEIWLNDEPQATVTRPENQRP